MHEKFTDYPPHSLLEPLHSLFSDVTRDVGVEKNDPVQLLVIDQFETSQMQVEAPKTVARGVRSTGKNEIMEIGTTQRTPHHR